MLLEISISDDIKIEFSEMSKSESHIVTFVATKNDIYPNKIENILIALKQISVYQDKNGGFEQAHNYSYLNLVGLGSGELYDEYKDGLNKYNYPVRANGICAIATGISMLLTAEGYMINEKWPHQDMYCQGPFSFPRNQVDAAVEFSPKNYKTYDLKWTQQKSAYVNFDVHVFPTGVNSSDTRSDGMTGISIVGLLVSIQFDLEKPSQTDKIDLTLDYLRQYRETQHTSEIEYFSILKEPKYLSLKNNNTQNWANLFYNVETLDLFQHEIKSNVDIQDILAFSQTVNSFIDDNHCSLNEFLQTSEWYSNYVSACNDGSINVDKAIEKGTFRQIVGEPMQCVGYVMMLSDLYPSLGFPDISGAVAEVAGQLVPDFVYGLEGKFSTGYGELALVRKSLKIEDYNAGDFFVIKGDPGHVGAILSTTDGKLLVADSNRLWDGKVHIFIVDKNNFDDVFGEEKYIILGHRCDDEM